MLTSTEILKTKQIQERKLIRTRQFKMEAVTEMEAPAFWREAQPSSATRKLEIILVPDCKTDSYKQQLEDNYLNMETVSIKLLQHGENVKTVDIQALQHTVVRSINTLTLSYRENNQNILTGILQARIQHSRLQKHFHHSSTHMGKMKNWKYGEFFLWKNWKFKCDFL